MRQFLRFKEALEPMGLGNCNRLKKLSGYVENTYQGDRVRPKKMRAGRAKVARRSFRSLGA